jgi:tetratricopeptide (TPR) repeat protein
MNKYFKAIKRMLIVGVFFPLVSFAQTHRAYADELFKKADYYHAFFLYRNLYGTNLSENQFAQRCNTAISLTKQFLDLRASKQYYDAKTKLRELLEINPNDFHAPILPQLSIEEATYWQKLALKQNSAKEVNLMLEKAISLYEQGKTDGWNQNEINDAIKQCEASKIDIGIGEKIAVISKIEIIQPIVETPIAEVKPETQPSPTPVVQVVHSERKKIPQQRKIVQTRSKKILTKRELATTK